MPILDIVDKVGKLRQLAPIIVASVMFSPADERRRDEIFAAGFVDAALQIGQSIPPKVAKVTHRGPSTANISREAGPQGYLGWIAGQILIFVLRCAAHRPEDASVRKAIYIVERALARETHLQERNFSTSTSKLRDAWGKYRSVCHLWAALHILEKEEHGLDTENLSELLGTAEFLRRAGETHYSPPKRVNGLPLLPPNETWRAPAQLNLPNLQFEAPPLSNQELDWLAEYRVQTD